MFVTESGFLVEGVVWNRLVAEVVCITALIDRRAGEDSGIADSAVDCELVNENSDAGDHRRSNEIIVSADIELVRGTDLFEIRQALGFPRLFPRPVERWKQHRSKNGDDRNYDYDNLLNIQYGVY